MAASKKAIQASLKELVKRTYTDDESCPVLIRALGAFGDNAAAEALEAEREKTRPNWVDVKRPEAARCFFAAIAAGRLADGVHVSNGYTSTMAELYHLGGADLALLGKPTIGATVMLEVHASEGANARLLVSPALAPLPIHIPGVGRLVLERDGLAVFPLGIVPAGGVLVAPFVLPSDPALIGTQLFLQVLTGPPDVLSSTFVPITLLP